MRDGGRQVGFITSIVYCVGAESNDDGWVGQGIELAEVSARKIGGTRVGSRSADQLEGTFTTAMYR